MPRPRHSFLEVFGRVSSESRRVFRTHFRRLQPPSKGRTFEARAQLGPSPLSDEREGPSWDAINSKAACSSIIQKSHDMISVSDQVCCVSKIQILARRGGEGNTASEDRTYAQLLSLDRLADWLTGACARTPSLRFGLTTFGSPLIPNHLWQCSGVSVVCPRKPKTRSGITNVM